MTAFSVCSPAPVAVTVFQREVFEMTKGKRTPVPITVPIEVDDMTPKQLVLLMRNLGVGKRNYAPPEHARPWSTAEFLTACTRDDVMRFTKRSPPERTTVEGWFSPNGPVPDDRRDAWQYFFHVFFADTRRAYGTQEWRKAYFQALRREKIATARALAPVHAAFLPLEVLSHERPL